MIDETVVEKLLDMVNLKKTEENKKAISGLLTETVRLGIVNFDSLSSEKLMGLIPLVRNYIEEVLTYGKDSKEYFSFLEKKMEEI